VIGLAVGLGLLLLTVVTVSLFVLVPDAFGSSAAGLCGGG
jgi:hypothetical protein